MPRNIGQMMSKPVASRGASQIQSGGGSKVPRVATNTQGFTGSPMPLAQRGASQLQNKARGTASSAFRKMI